MSLTVQSSKSAASSWRLKIRRQSDYSDDNSWRNLEHFRFCKLPHICLNTDKFRRHKDKKKILNLWLTTRLHPSCDRLKSRPGRWIVVSRWSEHWDLFIDALNHFLIWIFAFPVNKNKRASECVAQFENLSRHLPCRMTSTPRTIFRRIFRYKWSKQRCCWCQLVISFKRLNIAENLKKWKNLFA